MSSDIDNKYRKFLQESMSWLCNNSKQIDRVRIYCGDAIISEEIDNEIIHFSGTEAEKFGILYTKVGNAGFSKIDTIIRALNETQQDKVANEFLHFKNVCEVVHDDVVDSTSAEDDQEYHIDLVNRVTPLLVKVKAGVSYMDTDSAYRMRSKVRGLALIINNSEYRNPDMYRKGSTNDLHYLMQLFHQLKYGVTVERDVLSTDIEKKIENFKKEFEKVEVDSCVVILMGHGESNRLVMTDEKSINIWNSIIYKFNDDSCPKLKGKPKIFIIQACQGFQRDTVPHHDANIEANQEASDMLLCFPTIPGNTALRDQILGSPFVLALAKIFMTHAHSKEILKLFNMVASEMNRIKGVRQICTTTNIGFNKDFYFNPGLP